MDEIEGRVTNKALHDAVRTVHDRVDAMVDVMQTLVAGNSQTNQHMTGLEEKVSQLRETTNEALHAMDARVKGLETPWRILSKGWVTFTAGIGVAATAAALLTRMGSWPF